MMPEVLAAMEITPPSTSALPSATATNGAGAETAACAELRPRPRPLAEFIIARPRPTKVIRPSTASQKRGRRIRADMTIRLRRELDLGWARRGAGHRECGRLRGG